MLGVHRRLPQLVGIHLTETLVALEGGLAQASLLDTGLAWVYLYPTSLARCNLLVVVGLERFFVVDIFLLVARETELKQRWLGQVDMPCLHHRLHIAEEEGHEQCGNVAAVDIGISHDDNTVIAQPLDVKGVTNPHTHTLDEAEDLTVSVHFVEAGTLGVEYLTTQWQDSLSTAVAPSLGRAASRVTLHNVELTLFRVFAGAVG